MAAKLAWLCLALLAACAPSGLVISEFELDPGNGASKVAVTLPAHLDAHGVPAHDGHYSLHAKVFLPPELVGHDLDLLIPRLWALASLQVDGRPAVALAPERFETYRRAAPHEFRIDGRASEDGQLDLTLVVEQRWTQSAWFDVEPRLVIAGRRERATFISEVCNQWIAIAGLVTLLQFGFSAFVIFAIDRSRSLYLLFGIQAFAAAIYPAFSLGVSQALFGRFEVPMLGICLTIAGMAAVHFARAFYGLAPIARVWNGIVAVVLLAFAVVNDAYDATRFTGPPTIAILGVVIVFQIITGARQLSRPEVKQAAMVYLGVWVVLALTTWSDFFIWFGLGDVLGGAGLGSLGLMLTALAFAFLLSQRHMESLRRADGLNAELGQRVAELERRGHEVGELNQELRRQVVERSAQIYAALSLREQQVPAPEFRAGDVVRERFRVVGRLGTGGMGDVYEVKRLADGQAFALKVTHERHTEALALLAREGQIAARIDHPHVVRTIDVDVSSNGLLFLVMELVRGKPLNQLSDHYGDPIWAVDILRQLASGLSALHEAGIVHRDLKPPNVMITEGTDGKPHVKIADFGIARLTGSSGQVDLDTVRTERKALPAEGETMPLGARPPGTSSAEVSLPRPSNPAAAPISEGPLTRAGALVGTPAYMAPELARGAGYATPAADMFSFGLLAWELLTRGRPFLRAPAIAILQGEAMEKARSIREQWVEPLPELADLIDACLSMEPSARPSADTLRSALDAAHQRGVHQQSA